MFDFGINSAEEKISIGFAKEHEIELFIKRDDTIHPFISGNKWRKLKYILAAAHQKNKNHLVTFGGAYSNHLLATAAAGAKFGFKTTGFVRGDKVENQLLSLCALFGMDLKFTEREDYKNKTRLFDAVFGLKADAYLIDEGGASPEAVKGCAEIIDELTTHYDHIFCAAGTGTTAAGLLHGISHKNINTNLHVVSSLKGGDFLKDEINRYLNKPMDFTLHTQYHFGGYAKTTKELLTFIKDFASQTGILLDPVYTAKAMFAIKDLIKNKYFKAGEKILFVHTGGLFGLLPNLGEL